MSIIGVDLGATKLAASLFGHTGDVLKEEVVSLNGKEGAAVGDAVCAVIATCMASASTEVKAIGVAVPGISRKKEGTVWAPNIPGWEDYPLLSQIRSSYPGVRVVIESDRSCYIMGECWKGNARDAAHAIFLSVGTGIGAGILVDGVILRGAHDIAGAIGWWALGQPFMDTYIPCGYFEYYASGEGLRKVALEQRESIHEADGRFSGNINAAGVFEAYHQGKPWAKKVVDQAVMCWGMAAANLISIFNPEVIIFGGGVFGPAVTLLPAIRQEALRWAQPVAGKLVKFEQSALGGRAGVCGAGRFALDLLNQ